MKKYIFIIGAATLIFCAHKSSAQQEFTLYHMPVLSQSTYLNAASVPEFKVSLTLPGTSVFVGLNNSAFNTKAFVDKSGNVDYAKFVSSLKESNNYLGAGASVDLFNLRLKVANNFFSISSRLIHDTRFLYPQDLLGVVSEGFQDQYSLTGIGLHSSTYIENAVGFTRAKPDSRWTYGGRLKLLSGIANVQTNRSDLELNINNDNIYNYQVDIDLEVNSSVGIDETFTDDLGSLNSVNDYRNAVNLNRGYAIDGGVTYQHTNKLSFGLAVNNVGFINWGNYVRNYTSKFSTTYDGIVIEDFNNSGNNLDSVANHYQEVFKENTDTTKQAYQTWLPSTVFLSAHYQLSPKVRASGSIYTEFFRGISVGGTAGLNISLGKGIDFTTSWWYLRKSAANMGLGLVFKTGWVQSYIIMDNVLPLSFVNINDTELGINDLLLPYQMKNVNFRFGINLVFGRIKNESMLPAQGLMKRKDAFRKYLYKPTSN
ncbi:DUF5723 family protein [Marivirga sp.]|uniref:DUF5723 family protein n=1 Tax=Marivirga sp. TaxID=2018662 RepID=UPI0025EE8747|nr:DUF5723 family protein [Marivirga sp.]